MNNIPFVSASVKKYRSLTVEMRAALWFVFCSMLPHVTSVAATTVFTRILSTDDYGLTSNYAAWYSILSVIITLNLNAGVYNNAMLKYKDDRDSYDSATMGLSLVLGVIGGAAILLFNGPMSALTSLPFSLLVCMVLQCAFYNPYGCWLSRARYEYRYQRVIKITVITSLASPLLSVGLILVSENKAEAKVWGQYLVYIVLGAVLYLYTLSKKRPWFNREIWTYALRFNLPLIPHYFSLVILNQSDKAMITAMCGAGDNAIYSVAYSASALILIFNSSLTQAMTPWAYEKMKEGKDKEIPGSISLLYVLLAGIVCGFVLLAPEAIWILAGDKYEQSIYLIPSLATTMYFIFLYNMYSILEFYHERTKPVMVCSSLTAILNLALNYVFIQMFGYAAASVTTLVCYIFNSLLHVIVMQRLNKKFHAGQDVFCVKFSLGIGAVLVLAAYGCAMLYPLAWARWGLAGVIALVMLANRKRILALLTRRA